MPPYSPSGITITDMLVLQKLESPEEKHSPSAQHKRRPMLRGCEWGDGTGEGWTTTCLHVNNVIVLTATYTVAVASLLVSCRQCFTQLICDSFNHYQIILTLSHIMNTCMHMFHAPCMYTHVTSLIAIRSMIK